MLPGRLRLTGRLFCAVVAGIMGHKWKKILDLVLIYGMITDRCLNVLIK